jgi:hypothetical protein
MKILGLSVFLLTLMAVGCQQTPKSDRDPANKCWQPRCMSTDHTNNWRGNVRKSIDQANADAKAHDKQFHNELRTASVVEVDCK